MPLSRQVLWNVKEIGLQASYIPNTALPYYRNGNAQYTYHVTVDWRWDNNQRTCHVNIDPETGAHTDTTWF
ncbi:hypothetical protein L207DRAFT_639313 [Hyaloscypha variabilis F]|uniref:Uncharacterized protein n=1 Tax=Hyaloscypha variabilis (strain UAMH 11265 / GT02V1 / F) TaxID=1149755 RepID=A0A2J6R637_HYAVF|nr:hypothetical protein L207DRAFT_639313 [Hyaloscypha variabilis F]